jgi:hypothetical protein
MDGFGGRFFETIKGAPVNGLTLYGTGKIVGAVDSAAENLAGPNIPLWVRTPLVGVALALATEGLNEWLRASRAENWGDKVAEYTLANAVAQTLALAGGDGLQPGPLDKQVNTILAPVGNLFAPSPGTTTGAYTTGAYMNTSGYQQATQGMRNSMRGWITEHV